MENEKKNGLLLFLVSSLGKSVMIITLYVIILLFFAFILEVINVPVIAVIATFFFAFFGWKALSKITPDIFLIMPLVGWLIFFAVKGVLSVVVGVFVTPFVIAKKITMTIQRKIGI